MAALPRYDTPSASATQPAPTGVPGRHTSSQTRRLDLQLACTDKTPTRTLLDIWTPFPFRSSRFLEHPFQVPSMHTAVKSRLLKVHLRRSHSH